MECEAKTKTQHREHKGPSTEYTEKEADSRPFDYAQNKQLTTLGGSRGFGPKRKTPARVPKRGKPALQKKTPRKIGAQVYLSLLYHKIRFCQEKCSGF